MRIITFRLAVLCMALLTALGLNAQDLRPAVLVNEARVAQSFEERFEFFTIPKSATPVATLDAAGAPYDLRDLNPKSPAELRKAAPEILELTLPGSTGNVSLVRTNILADGFKITESGSNGYQKNALGLHYQSIVSGDPSSLVAISIFEGEVSGINATDAGNFVLGKLTKGEPIITPPQSSANNPLETLHVFPNSASNLLNLDISVKEATTASVRTIDVTGRTLHKLQQRLNQGNQQTTISIQDLPASTYLLRLEAVNGYSATTKFTVAR